MSKVSEIIYVECPYCNKEVGKSVEFDCTTSGVYNTGIIVECSGQGSCGKMFAVVVSATMNINTEVFKLGNGEMFKHHNTRDTDE
jgi:hypothetical protein